MKTFLIALSCIFQISLLNAQIELDGSNYDNRLFISSPISPVLSSALGDHPGNSMGYNNSVKIIGDVNGDGIDDILVGTRKEHDGGTILSPIYHCGHGCEKGRVYLILGRTQQEWESLGQNLKLDDIAFLIFKGTPTAEGLGAHLGKGDLNHDGYFDIIFSAFSYSENPSLDKDHGIFYQGKVFIIAGRSNNDWDNFKTENSSNSPYLNPQQLGKIINIDYAGSNDWDANAPIFRNPSTQNFVSFKGQHKGHYINGTTTVDYYDDMLGTALACQDLNDDGYDDLIIGSMGAEMKHYPAYTYKEDFLGYDVTSSVQNAGNGRVYIVKGGSDFFSKGINQPIEDACDVYLRGKAQICQYSDNTYASEPDHNNFDYINESIGYSIEPVSGFENTTSTSKGFIVGQQPIEYYKGYVYQRRVYYVNSSKINWGVKDNGFIENRSKYIINCPNRYPNYYPNDQIIYGWTRKSTDPKFGLSTSFFGNALATANFNGDAFTDIIVGDPNYCSYSFYNTGRIDIILGGIDYPEPPNAIQTNHLRWPYKPLYNNVDLTISDQPNIVTYVGWPANSTYGNGISNIGDINEDGYDDLIVGCSMWIQGRTINNYTRRNANIIYGHPVNSSTDTKRQFNLGARVEQFYCLKIIPSSTLPFETIFDNKYYKPWEYTFFLGEETARFDKMTVGFHDLTPTATEVAGGGDINNDGKPDFVICDPLFSLLKNKENDYITSDIYYSPNIKDVNIGKIYFINGDFNQAAFQRNKYKWVQEQYDLKGLDFDSYTYPFSGMNKIMFKSGFNGMSDLWIRDQLKPYYEDRGYEPNHNWSELWTSPDIWAVNNLNDHLQGGTTLNKVSSVKDKEPPWHCNMGLNYEQPEYGDFEHPDKTTSQKPVYIFVRIRNRGFEINDLFKENLYNIHLYWSVEGTQGWDISWKNYRPGGPGTKLYGNEIFDRIDPFNTSSVNSPPYVAPGEYKVFAFRWLPPKPADYPELKTWDGKIHVCFLARITGPAIPGGSPDGMSYIETTDLYHNVGMNNNIAWKNMDVIMNNTPVKVFRIGNTTQYNWPAKDNVYLLNGLESGGDAIFKIKLKGRLYSDVTLIGKAYLNLPKSLYDKCITNNATFNNLELKVASDDTINFEVTSDSAWITGIPLETNEIVPLRFYFMPNNDLEFNKAENIVYDLLQEKEGRAYPVGGATFIMILDTFTAPTVSIIDLTTTEVTSITQTTATSGGEITSDGGLSITEKGVCWGTSLPPTTLDNRTIDGSGTSSYTSSLTGLMENTIYYVRAYATNDSGTSYGNVTTFLTSGTPVFELTTNNITAITTNTATSGGEIITDGNTTVTEKGVCWSTTADPTIVNNKTIDGAGNGNYSSALTGLTANTTYFVRAYATSDSGTSYGNTIVFQTALPLFEVTTNNVTDITYNTATCGGVITSDGNSTVTEKGVCWSTSPDPTIANNKTNNGTGTDSYISTINGLTGSTTYYVRAFAITGTGTFYGSTLTFITYGEP
jgi:hypothetical protein